MNEKPEGIYTTDRVNAFLNMGKKWYIAISAFLAFYLGACLITFVEYILKGVDFINLFAVIVLFALGVAPAYLLGRGYYLSRCAIAMEQYLLSIPQETITWKALSKVCQRKNSIRMVARLLHWRMIKGVRIDMERKTLTLERNIPRIHRYR